MAKGKTVGSDVLGAPGAKVISADGTGNLSKQRRDDLVKKLGAIRSFLEKSAAVVIVVWGATDSGYYALDGSFSVTLDWTANVERFSSWLNWLNLGSLGFLASAACFAMWNYACKGLGVVRATVGLYLTPIVGVVFAALLLGERPTPMSVLGGAVIIVGVAIANWRKRGKARGGGAREALALRAGAVSA